MDAARATEAWFNLHVLENAAVPRVEDFVPLDFAGLVAEEKPIGGEVRFVITFEL
jgi:hypothetical protein